MWSRTAPGSPLRDLLRSSTIRRDQGTDCVMGTLRKRDVEQLMNTYDDDPVAALCVALRVVLDLPGADFATLLSSRVVDRERRARLLAADTDALDELARELNETRTWSAQERS